MKTRNPHILSPQPADLSSALLRLRSPNHGKPGTALLLSGISIGWLLHIAFLHLTQNTLIP